uniref:(California timema) hypothetical protein n=1 Tax=Timema californicum TaxID=61474 RepID=A0A7R9J481_TIMCA|nr:unnamed protein product [Timema californicum]
MAENRPVQTTASTAAEEVCRLCGKTKVDLVSIYSEEASAKNILQKMKDLLNINVTPQDKLSKRVCHPCVTQLTLCDGMVEFFMKNQEVLKKKYPEDTQPGELSKDLSTDADSGEPSEACAVDGDEATLSPVEEPPNINTNASTDGGAEQGPERTKMSIVVLDPESLGVSINQDMLFALHGLDATLPVACDFCESEFDDLEKFDIHMASHKEVRFFSCQLCTNTYMSWSNLVAHRKACHGGSVLSCEECSERRYHPDLGPVNYAVGDFPVGCEECGAGFHSLNELYRHFRDQANHNTVRRVKIAKGLQESKSLPSRTLQESKSLPFKGLQESKSLPSKGLQKSLQETKRLPSNSRQENKRLPSKDLQKIKRLLSRSHRESKSLPFKGLQETKSLLSKSLQESKSLPSKGRKENKSLPSKSKEEKVGQPRLAKPVKKKPTFRAMSVRFMCPTCGIQFFTADKLTEHLARLPKEGFVCETCNNKFCTLGMLNAHKRVHSRGKFAASICERHVRIAHKDEDETLMCNICKEHVEVPLFIDHYKACHLLKEDEMLSRRLSAVTCQICSKVFSTPATLNRHSKLHNPLFSRANTCEICQEIIVGRRNIISHARTHYDESNMPEKYQRISRSLVRDQKYRKTAAQKSYICEYCGREFNKTINLQIHIRRHTGEKPYMCQMCGMAFYTRQQLSIHIRTHTGERPYTCKAAGCGKTFSSPAAIYMHRKIHSDAQMYRCHICEKTFTKRLTYIGHVRAHTNERPFRCSQCPGAFTLRSKLNLHMNKHKQEAEREALTCSDCNTTFATVEDLDVHCADQCYITVHTYEEGEELDIDGQAQVIVLNPEDFADIESSFIEEEDGL